MITRADAMWWATHGWPMRSVPYSQTTIEPKTGYRQDCSGYVCMALRIPPDAQPGGWGGLNTVTLVTGGYLYRIDPDDLLPGDLIGSLGPGTAGDNGHIQIFTGWLNSDPTDSRYRCLEQSGGQRGPHEGVHDLDSNGYQAYRYRDLADVTITVTPNPVPGPTSPSAGEENDMHERLRMEGERRTGGASPGVKGIGGMLRVTSLWGDSTIVFDRRGGKWSDNKPAPVLHETVTIKDSPGYYQQALPDGCVWSVHLVSTTRPASTDGALDTLCVVETVRDAG